MKKDVNELTRLFDASEIDHWSDAAEASHKLPALVRRLVMATLPEPPSRIDMPSGSSVRHSGWDGLLDVSLGNPWVPSGVSGWEFSCDKQITSKANEDYEKRTADPLDVDTATSVFVFVTSRRWPQKRRWERARLGEGRWRDVRALDADDFVAWLEQSPEVAKWLFSEIYKWPLTNGANDGLEQLQLEDRDIIKSISSDVANIKGNLHILIASVANGPETPDPESVKDPVLKHWSDEIDASRDLIQEGLVLAGRARLERIKDEAEELPPELEFRLITNLAVCALGDDQADEACSLIDEAYAIQPDNPAALANAALAAQLRHNPRYAVELAQDAMALDPNDPNAAATLIGALWDLDDNERLEQFVASNDWLADHSICTQSLAGVRVRQSRYEEAIAFYRSLIASDPDDAQLRVSLSHCLLTYAQTDRLPVAYSNEALMRLQEAEVEASRAVDILQRTQLNVRRREALIIRSGARALLGKLDDARSDLDMVLGESPNHPDATLNKGLLLLKERRPVEARTLLQNIQDPELQPAALLPLADACLESGDAQATVDLLRGSFKLDPPAREDVGRAESLLRAEAATGIEDSVGPILEAALKQYPDEPGLLVLNAIRNNLHGNKEAAEAALVRTIELVDGPHRQAIQAQLGHLYGSMGRTADAAKQFAAATAGDASHPDSVPLLISLFNIGMFRRALDLVQKFREAADPLPSVVIEVEAAILEYAGDITTAVLRREEICSRRDSTQDDRMGLAYAQFRCGDREKALQTVTEIDTSELINNPQMLIKLAQLKRFLGATDYLDDAYLARRYGHNDPGVHLGYFRLFQGAGDNVAEPEAVGAGCAVLIRSGEEVQWWNILEEGQELYGSRDLSPEDHLAQRLLGRIVGDIITLRKGLEDLSCEIVAIQSKYARVFQETTEEFSTRFPENPSLSRIKLDDGFSQLYQSIELRSQFVRNSEKMYQTGNLPFASFCSLIGGSVLEVWPEYIMQPSARIHFGSGTNEEVVEASDILPGADEVVLDLVALLTVHKLGITERLRRRFSQVSIPQLAYDELQSVVNVMRMGRAPYGHLGKDLEGRYTYTKLSENDWAMRQEYAESVLELADSLGRIPSYLMLDAEDADDVVDALTAAGAGAVFAGDEPSVTKLVLVSDDLLQSSFARALSVRVVNSQSLLFELLCSDVILDKEYSSYIEQLTTMNYWFVRIRPVDILYRLEESGYTVTPGIQSMFRTLRGPDASEDTATTVAAEVIASLAKESLLWQGVELILSFAIAEIRHGRDSIRVLTKLKFKIAERLKFAPIQCAKIVPVLDSYMRL